MTFHGPKRRMGRPSLTLELAFCFWFFFWRGWVASQLWWFSCPSPSPRARVTGVHAWSYLTLYMHTGNLNSGLYSRTARALSHWTPSPVLETSTLPDSGAYWQYWCSPAVSSELKHSLFQEVGRSWDSESKHSERKEKTYTIHRSSSSRLWKQCISQHCGKSRKLLGEETPHSCLEEVLELVGCLKVV